MHKIGEHEGPLQTSSVADYMKPWIDDVDGAEDISEDENEEENERSGRPLGQDGRVYGDNINNMYMLFFGIVVNVSNSVIRLETYTKCLDTLVQYMYNSCL